MFKPFIRYVVKWPNTLQKSFCVNYVLPFYNITHERIYVV